MTILASLTAPRPSLSSKNKPRSLDVNLAASCETKIDRDSESTSSRSWLTGSLGGSGGGDRPRGGGGGASYIGELRGGGLRGRGGEYMGLLLSRSICNATISLLPSEVQCRLTSSNLWSLWPLSLAASLLSSCISLSLLSLSASFSSRVISLYAGRGPPST